ncbi:hypothetical protein [Streptacidiphilus sp. EB129]|uniref:hypothetical protein n=1 Tax=Streptacidiphilus sp. EB129 TaxID=3156262 RepID=UPI003517BFAF
MVVAACAIGASTASAGAVAQTRDRPSQPRVTASGSDLAVVYVDAPAAVPGGTTTLHVVVGNNGPQTTRSPFSVRVTLPNGSHAESPYFPNTCKAPAAAMTVMCTFPAGLPSQQSATVLIPVRVAANVPAPGVLSPGTVVVKSPDDPDLSNNTAGFSIPTALP